MTIKDKQIFLLKLLNNVMQPLMYKEMEDMGRNYKIEDNIHMYMVGFIHRNNFLSILCQRIIGIDKLAASLRQL